MRDPAQVRLGLGRAKRLRQRGEFARIREQGQRVSKGCLIANWIILPPGSVSRLGVITTRKLGKAHLRSRARRLLRESFRLHQHELRQAIDIVLIARASILGRKLAEVERDYLSALRQAGLITASL
jgi:ribonuclease P protein component